MVDGLVWMYEALSQSWFRSLLFLSGAEMFSEIHFCSACRISKDSCGSLLTPGRVSGRYR